METLAVFHPRLERRGFQTERLVNGTAVLREAITDGHLVEVHTGYRKYGAHNWDHVERLTDPEDDFQGGLAQDLQQCKNFINGLDDDLDASHTTQFVRPVEGEHNPTVRQKYADAGLSMVLWDIESKDATPGFTHEQVNNHIDSEMDRLLDAGKYQIVVLFHDLDSEVYVGNRLDVYLNTMKTAVENYEDPNDPDKEFNPVFQMSKERIAEILEAQSDL